MKKRMMLIINPMAGRSGYKTGFGEVMNILDSGGYLTTVYFTQGRGDATLFAAQHAAEYDTVACIGGDGTLSEVVSGLMQVPNPPPLGYIPMGTTNDVASTLGLPKNATDAALRIVTGTPTAFDVGSFGDQSFFTYVAAFGAFTAVSYETPQNEKQALGHLAYVLEGWAGSTASTITARTWSMTAARSTATLFSAACRTRPPWPAWCACARTS